MKLFLSLLIPFFLYGHSLKLFVKEENKDLLIKTYFNASSPCMQCNVIVQTKNDRYQEYKTDNKGELKLPLSLKPLSITVKGGLGHQKTIILDAKNKDKNIQNFPLWTKIIFAIGGFILFFAGLIWLKKR